MADLLSDENQGKRNGLPDLAILSQLVIAARDAGSRELAN
jgi:hypothetical protein